MTAIATVPAFPGGTVATQRSECWEAVADSVLDCTVRGSVTTLQLLSRQGQAEIRNRLLPCLREVRHRFGAGQTFAGFDTWEEYLRSIGLNENTWRSWNFRHEQKSEPFDTPTARPVSSDEWYTPEHIVSRVEEMLGRIDLDPCSNQGRNIPAVEHLYKGDDGLQHGWWGRVFMNPPFGPNGRNISSWNRKLITEYQSRHTTEAIALVPANRECFRTFVEHPVCVLYDRLRFLRPEGETSQTGKFDSAIVYLGSDLRRFYRVFHDLGNIRMSWKPPRCV